MLFNSYIFVFLFLPFTIIGYFSLNKIHKLNLAKLFLIIMSFIFYGYFNFKFLYIIISSIIINFSFSKLMEKSNNRIYLNALLLISMLFNIGILCYFKYFNFFIENYNMLFRTDFNLINVVLPLGISFFTFQQISYIVDCYKKNVPKYSFLDYSLFVSFFPQLVAGPIVLHNEIIPQFEDSLKKNINIENLYKGIVSFTLGLSKKVLLADTLSPIVDFGFSNIENLGMINASIIMLAYTFQIALDFSGYSDMAIGIGKMFNIDITLNFNNPYKSISISDFWNRWHMTLSRFLKTYIYFPLGGNRKGTMRSNINKFIVFLVSGLWHGANWTFILWGIIHGTLITLTNALSKYIYKIPKIVMWTLTFILINLSWVIFRAESINDSIQFYSQFLIVNEIGISTDILKLINFPELHYMLSIIVKSDENVIYFILFILLFLISFYISVFKLNTYEFLKSLKIKNTTSIITAFFLFWCIISFSGVTDFIYFNF